MGILKPKKCPACHMPKPCWCPRSSQGELAFAGSFAAELKLENCTTCGQPHPCRCGGGW